jgi:redox-sensitive bicupin YhaK (pirin superfamily)
MWVLPGARGAQPAYGQVEFPEADRLNRWLPVASGHHSVAAPVKLTQNAMFFVTRIEHDAQVRHTFEPGRLGFLFVAEGHASVEGLDEADAVIFTDKVKTGDAVRMANLSRVHVQGDALLVLWDVPPVST